MDRWDDYLRFRDPFREAIDERLYPIGHLDALIWSGRAQLLCTPNAAIAFEAHVYPSGARDVHGLVAAGELDDIVGQLIPAAEAWGRAHGCSGALIDSRPGWARALKAYGYQPHQVAVRKEL